jgi:integrase
MLDESGNVRKGFLKDEEYARLADECGKIGLWLRTVFEIYYTFGWRKNEPLETLMVRMVVFAHRTISIEDSKNGEGRIVVMTQVCCVPNLKVHDLRRTGARNLRRAGVDRDIIMRIGGWKTESVFRRYNIVDEADLRDATQKLENSQRKANVNAEACAADVVVKPSASPNSAIIN